MRIRFDLSLPNWSAHVIKAHLVVLNWLQLFCQMAKNSRLDGDINPLPLLCCFQSNQTNAERNISEILITACRTSLKQFYSHRLIQNRAGSSMAQVGANARSRESLYLKQKLKGYLKKMRTADDRSPVAVYVTPLCSCSLVIQGSID